MKDWSTIPERFWSRVNKQADDACWLWTGAKSGSGYGQFWDGTRTVPAHWFLLSERPKKKQEACHHCDNRLCVRPSHIFIGSHKDNMRDCVSKGRLRPHNGCRAMLKVRKLHRGSKNHASKLTEQQVQDILAAPKDHGSGAALARKYHVSQTVISGIRKGTRWAECPF